MSPKAKLFIAYILLLATVLFFSSCSQSKKLQNAKETMLANSPELAKLCAERFPAQETTIYLPGEVVRDTLYEFQELYIPVECPPSDKDTVINWKVRTIRETVKETKTDTVNKVTVDRAKEYALQSELDQLVKKNKELEARNDSLKKYRDWIWILIICLIIGGGLWFWFRGKTSVINSILKK